MEKQNKKKVGILMYPEMERRLDALFPLHGFSSRSEMVCKAVEFYTGFLESEHSEEYMKETTLAFLEDKLERLESRICKQLFRMCVETAMASHVFAAYSLGVDDETIAKLRESCIKDVRKTVGSIRYDSIYAFQHRQLEKEESDESEN